MKNPKGDIIPNKKLSNKIGGYFKERSSWYGYNSYNKNLNKLIENKALEFKKELIKKCTNAEKKFRSYLDRESIKYEFQKIIYIRDNNANIIKFFIADFYLKDYKVLVEIDGEYHNNDSQKEYDINRDILIKKKYSNISIIRITNEQVKDLSYIKGILDTYKLRL